MSKPRIRLDKRTFALTAQAKRCRANRHGWDDVPSHKRPVTPPDLAKLGQVLRLLTCPKCTATREVIVDRRGRIIKRRAVKYPEGYLLPKGSGRLSYDDATAAHLVEIGIL